MYSSRQLALSIFKPKSSKLSMKSYVSAFCHIWPCNKKKAKVNLIRQRKERDGLRLSSAMPKIQWNSNPHCPLRLLGYGKPWPFFNLNNLGSAQCYIQSFKAIDQMVLEQIFNFFTIYRHGGQLGNVTKTICHCPQKLSHITWFQMTQQ